MSALAPVVQDICYDPGHVYTFHIMQHIVDVANYRIPVPGFGKFNLLPYLQGQPIRFMAYDRNSQMHLWNLEVRQGDLSAFTVLYPAICTLTAVLLSTKMRAQCPAGVASWAHRQGRCVW